MSDITGPNPGEMIPNPEPEPETNNTSDSDSDSNAIENTELNQTVEPHINTEIETETTVNNQPETELEPTADNTLENETTTNNTDSEEVTEETQEEEKVAEEEKKQSEEKEQTASDIEVDRVAYEVQIQQANTDLAIQLQEEFQATQLVGYSGLQIYGKTPSVAEISRRLGQLWQQTGKKPAFINVSLQSNQLESFAVLPTLNNVATQKSALVASTKINQNQEATVQEATLRRTIPDTSRKTLMKTVEDFRKQISDPNQIGQTNYLASAQQLYQWLIAPIEEDLKANDIDILVFSMDSGLRLLPIGALYDGQQFLIEKYAVALVPSFGLTDTRYVDVSQSPILAMGASNFQDQNPLPTVPLELRNITGYPRQGNVFLNEQFTVTNFESQSRGSEPYRIIHLGTHAEFKSTSFDDSYIQFYDQKVHLPQLRQISEDLGWSTTNNAPIELLVLSACETALGSEKAELGFAGLAVQAGVKSALASLWYVSDLGTLALMSEFYDQLSTTLIKAEALRETQISMLRGEVMVDNGKLQLSNGESFPLPSQFPQKGQLELSHPYFWSPFVLIGNWN
jgi:CHAT domain-containing protein